MGLRMFAQLTQDQDNKNKLTINIYICVQIYEEKIDHKKSQKHKVKSGIHANQKLAVVLHYYAPPKKRNRRRKMFFQLEALWLIQKSFSKICIVIVAVPR